MEVSGSQTVENSFGAVGEAEVPVISKRQLKKLAKRKKWEEQKPQRKKMEKEKRKLKRKEALERGETVGPVRKYVKNIKMCESPSRIRIVIDFSLDHLMTDAERTKAYHQLQRCYSVNRRAKAPIQLFFTSFTGYPEAKQKTLPGYTRWDVHLCEDSYLDQFKHEEIVYLTSDSPNTLLELKDDEVYIIGGLVDHNRYKGICFEKAEEKHIRHAKLPLDDYIIMKTRKVLTIDQVFEILLKVSESYSWADAFLSVIPGRKGAVGKTPENQELTTPSSASNSETVVTRVMESSQIRSGESLQDHVTSEPLSEDTKEALADKHVKTRE